MGKVKAYNVGNLKRCHAILKLVAEVTETNPKDIKSRVRLRQLVDARRMFCVLARKTLHMPLKDIGRFIKRDHSSVLHYWHQHDGLLKSDAVYAHFFKLCDYAVEQGQVDISMDSGADFIDALVTENKYLKLELEEAKSQLSAIHNVLGQ
jgi:hypothetical protein